MTVGGGCLRLAADVLHCMMLLMKVTAWRVVCFAGDQNKNYERLSSVVKLGDVMLAS